MTVSEILSPPGTTAVPIEPRSPTSFVTSRRLEVVAIAAAALAAWSASRIDLAGSVTSGWFRLFRSPTG